MPTPSNFSDNRAALRSGVENLFPGFTAYALYGVAAVTITAAASFPVLDADGNALTIVGSATDPTYLVYLSFNLPAGMIADAANRVLKLASAATIVAGPASASSAVSGADPYPYTAASVRSASVPGTPTAVTANNTFTLYSTDGSNAAAGTLAAASGVVYLDCEIIYLKRKAAIEAGDAMRSKAQAYVVAGVTAGYL